MIYVASIQNGRFVKIGYSKDKSSAKRIATLQTGCPFEITLMFEIEGTLIQEQELHKALRIAFGRIRIPMPPNEWYPGGKHPFFKGFLEYLKYGFHAGCAYLDQHNPSVKPGSPKEGKNDLMPNLRWPYK